MRSDQRLILEWPEFSGRLGEFLQRLEDEPSLLHSFARDPSSVLAACVFPNDALPALTLINRGNRLLFALLSNERFMSWSEGYTAQLSRAAVERFPDLDPDKAAVAYAATLSPDDTYEAVVDAALRFVDKEMLAALLVIESDDVDKLAGPVDPKSPNPAFGWVAVLVLVFVVVAAVHAVLFLGSSGDVVARGVLPGLSRDDLDRISRMLIDALSDRADYLRRTGALASPEAARRGTIL